MKNVRLPRTGVAAVKKSAAAAAAAAAATGSPTHVATTSGTSRIEDVEYVSRARHEEMKKELDRLQVGERQRISALLEEAIKDGDLSENAGYEDAKMRQGLLEARIRELESKLRHVALIEDQDNDGATIGVGSRVKLREIATDDEVEYQVVGPEETDPRLGKISHRSPVGKALIGKTAGEETDVVTPGGTTRYLIVSVERGA
jgi:transcription elongation factor GreA